jgi:hypothetical protein
VSGYLGYTRSTFIALSLITAAMLRRGEASVRLLPRRSTLRGIPLYDQITLYGSHSFDVFHDFNRFINNTL